MNRDTDPFDWYQRYSGIKDILTQYINTNHQLLNIGAGNSSLYNKDYQKKCSMMGFIILLISIFQM